MPTVMLFVRSKRGLSHTREEDTDEADLELALTALERLVRTELRPPVALPHQLSPRPARSGTFLAGRRRVCGAEVTEDRGVRL